MLNFNTKKGKPIHIDGSEKPIFYIDVTDVRFIEKLHELYIDVKNYSKKSEKKEVKTDENGVPSDLEFIDDLKSDFDFILSKLDNLLGDGVTEKVFKGNYSQELLGEFIGFLSDIVKDTRKDYVDKYKKITKQGVL
jgi:hypothetical protein